MNDEEDFFRQSMAGVKPIESSKKVNLQRSTDKTPGLKHRQQAAVEQTASFGGDPLSDECIEPMAPLAVLEYQGPGVQRSVYKSLRQGKVNIDVRLDLHNMTIEQARQVVYQFVSDCVANDIRCALITHGKGEGREKPGLLKSCVAHWLPQMEAVLAFHSAQKHHGGAGATYLLLRKSSKKRLENKDDYFSR